MSEHKFSAVIGLGGNSYSNLHVFGDTAEELRENLKATRTGPQGESPLELAVETVRGVQGLYAAAQKLADAPAFLERTEEPKAPESAKKTAPAKKGVAAKKAEEVDVEEPSLGQQIQVAATEDDLNKLWRDNKDEFKTNQETLKPLMVARRAELREQQ